MGDHGSEGELRLSPKFQKNQCDIWKGDDRSRSLYIDVHPHKPWILFTPWKTNSVQVWNYEDGTQVASWLIPMADGRGEKAKFIAQNEWTVVQFGWSFKVYEIQGASLRCIRKLKSPGNSSAWGMVVHHTLSYLLTGFGDGSVILWDWDRKKRYTLRGHSDNVRCLAFHPTEAHIFASGSDDRTIKVWDREKGSVSQILQDMRSMECPLSIEFRTGCQESLLITGHQTGKVRVWDYASGVCVARLEGHEDHVCSAFFHQHLRYIFSASCDGDVRVWSASNYQLVSSYQCGLEDLATMAPGASSRTMLVLGGGGSFMVLEVSAGKGEEKDNEEQDLENPTFAQSLQRNPPLDNQTLALRQKIEELEKEADQVRRGLTKKTETEVAAVELKYRRALEEVTAEHQENKRAQATRLQQLEARVETFAEEKAALAVQIQALAVETANLAERLEKSNLRIQELELERATMVDNFKLRIAELEKRLENAVAAREIQEYSLQELEDATDNFDMNRKCGHHDDLHESMYSGTLHDGTAVMVKKLRAPGMRGMDRTRFKAEVVDRLRALNHPHLLRLLGFCYDENCLVYEGMGKGSVKEWIGCREKPSRGCLPWYIRFRVLAEVAQAVCFLHSNWSVVGGPIIHRAIKPANIFLDNHFTAKVGCIDQALLVSLGMKEVQPSESPFCNFLGRSSQYMAPEYWRSGLLNEKTDIYAFGITLLEMLTGRFLNALGTVEDAIIENDADFKNALDAEAGCWDVDLTREVASLGLRCASLDRRSRPEMMTEDVGILPVLEGVGQKCARDIHANTNNLNEPNCSRHS